MPKLDGRARDVRGEVIDREEAHWKYDTDRKDERESTALNESSLEHMDSDSDLEDVIN